MVMKNPYIYKTDDAQLSSTANVSMNQSNFSELPTDIFSINIHDYNSSSTLYNVNSLSNLKNVASVNSATPVQTIKTGKNNSVQNQKGGFNFNRNFLIIPLIAFSVVAIVAIICGTVFGIISQNNLKQISQLAKDEKSYLLANTTKKILTNELNSNLNQNLSKSTRSSKLII
jgi:hypothetical protein